MKALISWCHRHGALGWYIATIATLNFILRLTGVEGI